MATEDGADARAVKRDLKALIGPAIFAALALLALRGCVGCMNNFERAATEAAVKHPAAPGDALRQLKGVSEVEIYEINVFLTARFDRYVPAAYLEDTGALLRKVAETVRDQPGAVPASVQHIVILVQAPLTDRLGNSEYERILNLRFSLADLKAARLDNLSNAELLDLSTEARVSNRSGGKVADEWCADFAEFAPNICGQLIN